MAPQLPEGFEVMPTKASGPFAGWVWPVPIMNGRKPFVSQGFNPAFDARFGKKHAGMDLMYVRYPDEPSKLPEGVLPSNKASKRTGYYMPSHTVPVLAAGNGVIVQARKSSRGHHVLINHGNGYYSFYQHLTGEYLPPEGTPIAAGMRIGTVGNGAQWDTPQTPVEKRHYPLNHLHFELWPGGKHERAIDPQPIFMGLVKRS